MTKNPAFRYPLAYISRTISEFNSICFADCKQPHRFAIYDNDLHEIERQSALLLSDQFSKSVHVLSVDPPTHTQHYKAFSIDSSFDPAAHRRRCPTAGTQLGISAPARTAISRLDSTVRFRQKHATAHSKDIDYKGVGHRNDEFRAMRFAVFAVFAVLRYSVLPARSFLAELESAFVDLELFNLGPQSRCRDSELGRRARRSVNPASALSQCGFDERAFFTSLVFRRERALKVR